MKLILKSLINNDACIEGGRKRKWWISIILLLLSLIFAVIPSFSTRMSTKGSSYISGNMYGIDYAFQDFLENNQNTVRLTVNEDKKLEVSGWDSGKYEYHHLDSTNVDAYFYYVPKNELSTFELDNQNVTSFIFSDEIFYFSIVNPNKKDSQVLGLTCQNAWKEYESGYELISSLYNEKQTETAKNLLNFFDKVYEQTRVTDAWTQTGIMTGINVIVIMLMALMVFILTRGKTNVFRIYSFWDCMKISFWAALAPAILAIPLGFLITNFMSVWFPMLYGIRTMWLTMKSLRPDGTGYQEASTKQVKTVDVKKAK